MISFHNGLHLQTKIMKKHGLLAIFVQTDSWNHHHCMCLQLQKDSHQKDSDRHIRRQRRQHIYYVNYIPIPTNQVHNLEHSHKDLDHPLHNYPLYSEIDEFAIEHQDVQILMKTNNAYATTALNIRTRENEAYIYRTTYTLHSTNTVGSKTKNMTTATSRTKALKSLLC